MAVCELHRKAMQGTMNMLKELTLAAVPRESALTPRRRRRNKLIGPLAAATAMVVAEIKGRIYAVNKRRWSAPGDGQTT